MKIEPETVYNYGKALLVVAAIVGGTYSITDKTVSRLKKVPDLERRVKNVERRTRFMVRGIEKLTKEKYEWRSEERETHAEGED